MKSLKIIIIAIITTLFINTSNAQKKHTVYYDSGNLKEEGQFDSSGKGTGDWKTYYENGTLKVIGSYTEGKPDGEFKFYNKLGWLYDIHNYNNGEKISLAKGCYYGNCDNGYGKKFLGFGKRHEGNFVNGKLNGKGIEIKTLSGISFYEGNFTNGKKDGKGTEIITDLGQIYVGFWRNDKKNGEGTESQYNKLLGGIIMKKYSGNWKGGKKNGEATIIEYGPNGKVEKRKLIGDWTWSENDKPNGEGKEYINGELVYEGTFKNGKAFKTEGCIAGDCEDGQGVFVTSEHIKYIGGFKNGKKNGFGLELDPKQGMYIIVNWKDDKEDGYARIFNVNNELVFAFEMKDGNAISEFSENGVSVGCVKGDCKNGFGYYVWDDGTKYMGEFKNGLVNGLGTLIWAEGKFIGSFIDAKRCGYGREYDKDNVLVKQGEWDGDLYYPNLSIEKKYSINEKCTVGNCIDGFGIFIETFEPGWNDAFRDYVNTYEIKYEGFWKDGKFNGLGFTDDRMARTFVGQFKNGQSVK
jgi:antitoxin component YwqK of YwqJK toxin-antitoxin module